MVDALFAFIARDEGGHERLMTAPLYGGGAQPLVFAQREAAASVVAAVQQIAEESGRPFRIVRFAQREDVTDQF